MAIAKTEAWVVFADKHHPVAVFRALEAAERIFPDLDCEVVDFFDEGGCEGGPAWIVFAYETPRSKPTPMAVFRTLEAARAWSGRVFMFPDAVDYRAVAFYDDDK